MPNPENIEKYKFKEGESGNPSGRPKGTKNLSTILKRMLEEEIEIKIDGVRERKTLQEVLIRKLITKATSGDLRAIVEIFDRVEGKATVEVNNNVTATAQVIAYLPEKTKL